MPKVADQAVGDVDHRLGARLGRHPTLSVRRLRNQMAPTQLVESLNTVVPQRISSSRTP